MNEMPLIHALARAAAQAAVDRAIDMHGEDHPAFRFCGFAWVTIKPARGKFITELKRHNIGRPGVYGGWTVSSYDMFDLPHNLSQSMELKEIGGMAYADTLSDHGINASAGSRAD